MDFFKQGFTLVIIPRRAARVIRINVSGRALIGLAAGTAILAIFAAVSLFRAADLRLELAGYNGLKNDYLRQQVEIKKVANQLDQFKDQIGRMKELDYKLRLITDLQTERSSVNTFAVGGEGDPATAPRIKDADLAKLDLLPLLDRDLARLQNAAQSQEQSFNNLKSFLADKRDLIERTPYRWPVRGFLSSVFGQRMDPFTGEQRIHEAIDIVAPRGTPVKAPADGIATFAGQDSTFGNMLVVDHGYGVITRYGHCDTLLVREGQRIKRGDTIALVGSTGRSTGAHLHYEIRLNDVAVNPLNIIIN